MIKKTIKKYSKKIIEKACACLPPIGKRVTAKAALCALNSMRVMVKPHSSERLSVAVLLSGGLGDSLIALAWLKELHRNLSVFHIIDVYGRTDFLPSITLMQPYIANVVDHSLYGYASGYDVKLQFAQFIKIDSVNAGRVHAKSPDLENLLKIIHEFNERFSLYANHQPELDGAWASYCTLRGWDRWKQLSFDGSFDFSRKTWAGLHLNLDKFSVLEKFGLKGKPYITIHAGCDTAHRAPSQCTKIWPRELWGEFCKNFKTAHPEIIIVHIGAKGETAIHESDIALCGKIDLMESFVLLKHALVHVDGESGLVHIRHQLGGKSVVMFGPTPEPYFGYENNINIVSHSCYNCMWKTKKWSYVCANGFSRPECMFSIQPHEVLEAVEQVIEAQKSYEYSVQDVDIYSSTGRLSFMHILDEMCSSCSLEKKDISEHIYGAGHTYIHASKQWEYPYVIGVINRHADKPLRIADIGGGRGVLAWYLAILGHDVSVFDINYKWDDGGAGDIENQFFKFAKENNFHADYGSVFNIPAEDGTFDVVTCVSVVEHIPFKEFALKEMLRVLKPCGKLILTYDLVLSKPVGRDSLRVEIFTPESICCELRKLGIQIDEVYSTPQVMNSLKDIFSDRVNIAEDMTVGALVLSKEACQR
jgi:SAM-dependent methyltransferase